MRTTTLVLLWLARITAVLAVVPLMLAVFGEPGPTTPRECLYLALFPFGFALGYAVAWRWPLGGGCVSLACLAASLLVIGRAVPWPAYLVWAVLGVPGVLFIVAGLYDRLQPPARPVCHPPRVPFA